MDKTLTLVFGYRNREIERVERCLNSLRDQSDTNFEVIFVDYGSDPEYSQPIENFVSQLDFCTYIYNDTKGWNWNRSHALNTGIKLVKTDYVVTSDVDLIYDRRFVQTLKLHLAPDKEIHFNAYSLPHNFKAYGSLTEKPRLFKQREKTAHGLVQGVHIDKIRQVNGFNEYYRIWGIEDNDLNHRLKEIGVTEEWVDIEECPVYHQWHPQSKKEGKRKLPGGWLHHLAQKFGSSVTNQFGRLIRPEDRDIYDLVGGTAKPDRVFTCDSNGSLFYFLNDLHLCLQSNPYRSICLHYHDDRGEMLQNSGAQKLKNWLNKSFLLDKLPFKAVLNIEFDHNYISKTDFKDMANYFLLQMEDQLSDFYMMDDGDFKVIISFKGKAGD